jgi:hypothetical protein
VLNPIKFKRILSLNKAVKEKIEAIVTINAKKDINNGDLLEFIIDLIIGKSV